jgi:hypothetical protein
MMCAMRILLALILVGILLPSTAMAEQFVLVCHLVPRPGMRTPESDRNFVVDFDKRSVDGLPAAISEIEIIWKSTGDKGSSFTTRINRLTGAIEVWESDAGVLFTGNCVKATQRKF